MLDRNKSAHRGGGGRAGIERGQRFISYPQYTLFLQCLQSPIVAGGYVLRDGLLLVAQGLSRVVRWLADQAERLDGSLWRRGIGS
jgi:hypothetical protein